MTYLQDFVNWFAPRTRQERKDLATLYEEIFDQLGADALLQSAFALRKMSIDSLLMAFHAAIEDARLQYQNHDKATIKGIACLSLLFPHLPPEHQDILNRLRIFCGIFPDTTATAILSPNFHYQDETDQSDIDLLLEKFFECGLLKQIISGSWADDEYFLYEMPDFVRIYLEKRCESPESDPALIAQYVDIHAKISEGISQNIEFNPAHLQIARFIFRDLRRALDRATGEAKMRFAFHCARIAGALGDQTLEKELAALANQLSSHPMEMLIAMVSSRGLLLRDMQRVFPGKPATPQEELDYLLSRATDPLIELGILRKMTLDQYDFLITFPEYVKQINFYPDFPALPDTAQLDNARDAILPALRRMRRDGFVPEAALLSFALGRLYALKRSWTQSNTQLENAVRLARQIGDGRLEAAAHHEIAAIRIYQGRAAESHTSTCFAWAVGGFRKAGDFANSCAASLAQDVYWVLRRFTPRITVNRTRELFRASGLSKNGYQQSADDIETFYDRLSRI